jgi:hypothetical protein
MAKIKGNSGQFSRAMTHGKIDISDIPRYHLETICYGDTSPVLCPYKDSVDCPKSCQDYANVRQQDIHLDQKPETGLDKFYKRFPNYKGGRYNPASSNYSH